MKKLSFKQQGFSLIELLVVVVIIGIGTAIGVPSYQAYIQDRTMTAKTNEFITTLSLARTEARRAGSPISIVANGADWSAGWRMGNDLDNNNAISNGELIRVYDGVTSDMSMTTANNIQRIVFDRRGFIVVPAAQIIMTVCDGRTAEDGRQVLLNITGRADLNPTFTCS